MHVIWRYDALLNVPDGIESTMAKAAAGERNVLVLGAYTAQRALEAGVLDELQIPQISLLFGGGRGLFEVLVRSKKVIRNGKVVPGAVVSALGTSARGNGRPRRFMLNWMLP